MGEEKISTITFNEFIDVSKPFGKIFVVGLEGFGKTLLLETIAEAVMLNGLNDCFKSYEVVDRYNSMGFHFTKDYEHLCFSAFIKFTCVGTLIPDRESYDFDPFHFALFCDDYDTDIYPPYATLLVPEAQRVWPSYKAENIRPEVFGNMETGRQAKFNLVMDAQRLMMVAKPVRDLCNRILLNKEKVKEIKDTKGNVIGHLFHLIEFNSNADAEAYVNSKQKKECKEYYLKIDRCRYDNFLSDYFEFMHLIGREEQDFRIVRHTDLQSTDDINNMTSILAPEGYFVSKGVKSPRVKEPQQVDDEDNDVYF